MKVHVCIFVLVAVGSVLAQITEEKAAPQVRNITIGEDAVTAVYLSPGYATSIRLPDEISSVAIGSPANFRAEHSDSEPRLVFVKPITARPAESNALITTKSGQEISLHLISGGQAASQSRVDFLLQYGRPRSMLIPSNGGQSFFVSPTKPIVSGDADVSGQDATSDPVLEMLTQQKAIAVPHWEGSGPQISIGDSRERDRQTILGFSVLNNSDHTIELQLPQIELSGRSERKKKQIKAEPVAIVDCQITTRRLGPWERADGVIVFERPSFKESGEQLKLQIAESGQVDHPSTLAIPFVAANTGGAR